MMKVKGLHVLAEIFDCDMDLLADLDQLETIVKDTAAESGLVVEDSLFHQYNQEGISGVLLAPHANMSVHTWPQSRRLVVDIISCAEDIHPLASFDSLISKFNASHMTAEFNKREIDVGSVETLVS